MQIHGGTDGGRTVGEGDRALDACGRIECDVGKRGGGTGDGEEALRAAERDRDVQYGLALRLLEDEVRNLAKRSALAGGLRQAGDSAEFVLRMVEDMGTAAAYGIDKKVHLSNLIRGVARHKASLAAQHMDFA